MVNTGKNSSVFQTHAVRIVGDFCRLLEAIDPNHRYGYRSAHKTCNEGCYFDVIQTDRNGNETVIIEFVEASQTLVTLLPRGTAKAEHGFANALTTFSRERLRPVEVRELEDAGDASDCGRCYEITDFNSDTAKTLAHVTFDGNPNDAEIVEIVIRPGTNRTGAYCGHLV